ncbi:MAG: membrane fusion protein (multidrug efflux system) [Gammaproteobacteria bacterium]|jgi:membrane fusion protein (multidrug efflux system)
MIHLIRFLTLIPLASVGVAQETSPYDSVSPSIRQYADKTIRGQLRARNLTILSAGISGNINEFNIAEGQYVDKGQQIAIIDCRMEEANREIAKAKLEAAHAKHQVYQRLEKLENISGLELTLSKADVAIASAELQRIQVILSECVIRAPFSGAVIVTHAQAYQYVNIGDPLLEILDPNSLEVEMVLPSEWLTWLVKGTEFTIRFDENNKLVNAYVDRVVESIDPVSQTVRVIGVIDDSKQGLLSGMSGEIIFSEKH